jgi:hypothetical protein
MNIKYISTYWGQGHLPVGEFVAKAIGAGFDGVEVNVPFYEKCTSPLLDAIKSSGTSFILQQYLPPMLETFEHYRTNMNDYLLRLAALNPLFINSHTGKDYYSFDENSILIEDCISIIEKTGKKVVHETHRSRFSYHASSLIPYIHRFHNLEFTADFSHFCVVSESLLKDQEQILEKIIPRCSYIHARVGYSQAAQVNHPFAPEWQATLEIFVGWWQRIIDSAKSRGETTFYICPEFGPAPYMPALPFTQQPIANQWDINVQLMIYLRNILH